MKLNENLDFNNESQTSKKDDIINNQLAKNLSQNEKVENETGNELENKIQESWSYFVWLLLDNPEKKNEIINELKNSNYKTSTIKLREDRMTMQDDILQNLSDEVIDKLYDIEIYKKWMYFRNKEEKDAYFNMLCWYKLGNDPKQFLYRIRDKESLHTLLIITQMIKDNPNLKNEKIWLILDNYNVDIYSLHSALQSFFYENTDYDFLSNCKFIMFDKREWKNATKYLKSNIWSATKDRILCLSSHIKV